MAVANNRIAREQPHRAPQVLILGAGINGCALARELALNGVAVTMVDTGDVASGTTAYSSRLIHGGLRYLEYGEFDLVRESLAERTRLLRLAPQFVRPLRLFVPVSNRCGGLATSAKRFLRLGDDHQTKSRGVWLVRIGLWMYDRYARDPSLPRHRAHAAGQANTPPVDARKYRWLCSYFDAQVQFPERFTLGLTLDALAAADEARVPFRLFTYHEAQLNGRRVRVTPIAGNTVDSPEGAELEPDLIVNATGAWVDETLRRLNVPSRKLLAGTKGTHFFTAHAGLRKCLADGAIYGEAEDGRPVFILPLAGGTLVGTTDIRYDLPPETAVATADELSYLVKLVNDVFPDVRLTVADVDWHYAGVRPLPSTDDHAPASVTRRHWLEEQKQAPLPMFSLIGGKLTTCRSLAQESTPMLLARLGMRLTRTSAARPLPGGQRYPKSSAEVAARQQQLAARHGLRLESVRAIWQLYGNPLDGPVACYEPDYRCLPGTELPLGLVRRAIELEFVSRLNDLVERRLMLLYEPGLCHETLATLAQELVAAGKLASAEAATAVAQTTDRLLRHFGRKLR